MREYSTEKKLKELNLPVTVNLDPTLILDTEEWLKLTTSKNKTSSLVLYMLNTDDRIKQYVQKISSFKKISKIYTFSKQKFGLKHIKSLATSGPNEFITHLYNSSFVFTNSFHGTVFAIILKKEFVVILPKKRPERIMSLLKKIGLENRIVNNIDDLEKVLKQSISFDNVEKVLNLEKGKTERYIINNLKEE